MADLISRLPVDYNLLRHLIGEKTRNRHYRVSKKEIKSSNFHQIPLPIRKCPDLKAVEKKKKNNEMKPSIAFDPLSKPGSHALGRTNKEVEKSTWRFKEGKEVGGPMRRGGQISRWRRRHGGICSIQGVQFSALEVCK